MMGKDVEVANFREGGGGVTHSKAAKTAPEQSPDTLPTAGRLTAGRLEESMVKRKRRQEGNKRQSTDSD